MQIAQSVTLYLRHLAVLGRSPLTIRGAKYGLRDFGRFLTEENITAVHEITGEVLMEYQQELAFRLTKKHTPLALRTQTQLLGVVKNFSSFLAQEQYLAADPGEKIQLPKKPHRLPKVILSPKEMLQLLNSQDMQSNNGFRNRIILEVLYDTGIRRAELIAIKLRDLDLEAGYLHIRCGKGAKDRVVPLSPRVCNLIKSYLYSVRPAYLQGKDDGSFLLNRWGKPMGVNGVWAVVKRCVLLAGLKKNISPHTFRHTCATHMLKHGAPVRHVQELLGHESLESTQLYTHVTINDLKEVHARYHPSETMAVCK